MFSKETYSQRRARLRQVVGSGLILFPGNNEVGMNYKANTYHFRQDSHFLYYFGLDQPGLAAVMDLDENLDVIFGDELTMEDVVWTGALPTIAERAAEAGVSKVLSFSKLAIFVKNALDKNRPVHFTPPYRHDNMILLGDLLGLPTGQLKERASVPLIRAIVAQRSYKTVEEIVEMELAVNITGAMHEAVMRAAAPGRRESDLAGVAQGIATGWGNGIAYGIILTVNGQILHNHGYHNTLQSGQLLLGDHGAESPLHYAGDITRTCPVDPKFADRQRDVYNIVLDAELEAVASLRPGLTYREVHLAAARRMAKGLKSLGLMKGNLDEAVAQGAHALFFPHGLGHMIGLDVHDMEDLGEDYVGYSGTVRRSEQFGTAYLRLGRALEPGFVLTVEPGLYFIPELMDQWQAEGRFTDFINYEKLKDWRTFGGIRIEDNVLITETGHRVLGRPIPKTVAEVEGLRST